MSRIALSLAVIQAGALKTGGLVHADSAAPLLVSETKASPRGERPRGVNSPFRDARRRAPSVLALALVPRGDVAEP